jgi:hypothetical protein
MNDALHGRKAWRGPGKRDRGRRRVTGSRVIKARVFGLSRCLARGNEPDVQCLRFDDHARDMAFEQLAVRKRCLGLCCIRCSKVPADAFGGTVLGGVTVPLFDGGTRAALLEQAQSKSENAGLVLTRTRDEAVRQIVLANNALRTSLSAYNAAAAVVSAANTTFDAALAAYRNGVGSITDATMAETQLLQARNASTDAYSTALSAAATLALSTGSLGAPLQ